MAHDFAQSAKALKRFPEFAPLVTKFGPPDLRRYHGARGIFESLLRSIVFQQLSGAAARTIHARVCALYPRKRPTPALVLRTPASRLRAAGLSTQKVAYVQDLARRFESGDIRTHAIRSMQSTEIVEHLTEIKGVGVWTVQMLLIFTLRRPDILPVDDLGIRKGFQRVYGLSGLPKKADMERLAAPWLSHATAASWYLWRSLDPETPVRQT